MRGGALTAKKTLSWLIIAFVVFYIITQPQELAHIIRSVIHLLHRAADSISELINNL